MQQTQGFPFRLKNTLLISSSSCFLGKSPIHGHTHVDSLNTSQGFNIIGTRCDGREENTDVLKNERVKGTVTEQSFTVFTVTKDKIYATKIGAGSDREISY